MSHAGLLLMAVLALASAGCLVDRAEPTQAGSCRVLDPFRARHYDDAVPAPNRTVRVEFLHLGGPIAFAWEHDGTIHAIGSSAVMTITLPLPADRDITVLAGLDEQERWAFATVIEAGTSAVTLAVAPTQVGGSITGTWTTPVSTGPTGTVWQPHELPLASEGLERMLGLDLELEWDNGPGGGADFGIAVGPVPEGGFHYTNAAYQATPGPQRESRSIPADQFLSWGWGGQPIRVGPSVSTGAFATTGIEYELAWTARLASHAHDGRVCPSTDAA